MQVHNAKLCRGVHKHFVILRSVQTILYGKSHEAISRTIVNLLMRFYDIDSGKIMISNQNLGEIARETLRKNAAIVLQDTVLF